MSNKKQITLFGIPNCDTVKKARVWLDENNVEFIFHNFKKEGLASSTIEKWLTQLDLDTIINRKGTTWRALTDAQKQSITIAIDTGTTIDIQGVITLIVEFPSIIKRPVLQIQSQKESHLSVGFNSDLFTSIFKNY
jgi:arsenate reductase